MDITARTGLDKISRDTRLALALYHNSTTIKDYVMRWSRYEDAEKLEERKERTFWVYRNYVREAVQKYLEGLYKRQDFIQRTSTNRDFNNFLNGYYDAWFRREVAPVLLLLPEVYVMIVPAAKGGFRPAVVFPQYVTNFSLSTELAIETIDLRLKQQEIMRIDAQSVQYYAGSEDEKGKTSWWPSSRETGETQHNLGFCPVIRMAFEENVEIATLEGTPVGHSFMYPTIMQCTADLQYRSMMVEAAHGHLFYQLIMGAATATETLKSGMGSDMPIIEPENEHGSTRYLQKPTMEISTLRQIVHEDMPKEIFEAARLQGRFSNSAQTGAARLQDLYPENGALTSISNYFWDADNRIVQMLAKAMGVDAQVRYPTVFDTRSPSDTLRDAQTFQAIAKDGPVAPSALKEVFKQAQRALMPGVESVKLVMFDKETDRAPIPFLIAQKASLAKIERDAAAEAGAGNPPGPAGRKGGIPPTGPTQGDAGPGAPPSGQPKPQDTGDSSVHGTGQGSGSDDMGDGGMDEQDRGLAGGMAITLVANCEEGEEEEEYEQLLEGLTEAGYQVSFLNTKNSLETLFGFEPTGVIWNAIEGFHDKAQFEMHCAAYFELAHFKFTGSGAKTLGLLQDKAIAKTVLAGVGLAVKRAVLVKRGVDVPDTSTLAWPRMVKPAAEDASEGITAENVTHNDAEMQKVISRLFTITDSILVEEYVDGRELLVGVLGNGKERVVLPPMEIEFTGEAKIVTQDAKQNSDSKDFDEVVTTDAVLTDAERIAVEDAVLLACRALEIKDYARVDIRLTKEGIPFIIEINPNPDLSPDHGFGGSAQLAGMTFPQLLDRIVKIAQKRYEPRGA